MIVLQYFLSGVHIVNSFLSRSVLLPGYLLRCPQDRGFVAVPLNHVHHLNDKSKEPPG